MNKHIPRSSHLTPEFSERRRNILKHGALAVSALAFPWLRSRDARSQTQATFDYYISPTGNDSNPGTQAAPWAITSLSPNTQNSSNVANWNKIAGKRIGLLSGTYNVFALWQSASYNVPALDIPGGTAGANTVIQSVTPQGAHITANNNGSLPGSSGSSVSIIGQGYKHATGYVTFDGLVISDSNGYGIWVQGNDIGGQEGGGGPFVIQNCEIYNIGGDEGNNPACIMQYNSTGNLIQNCKLHDCTASSGGSNGHNFAGIFSFNCHANTYQYNTIYNCNSGIYDKNSANGGHTYYANYIEVNGSSPFACVTDSAGGKAGDVRNVHHNVFVIASGTGNNNIYLGLVGAASNGDPQESLLFYNNTCYALSGGGWQGGLVWQSQGNAMSPAASVKQYNNIYSSGAPGEFGDVLFNPTTNGVSLSDYNCYTNATGSSAVLGMNSTAGDASLYSLATWRSNFALDTHSITGSPAFTNAGVALTPSGYTLGSGSACNGAGRVGGTSSGAACNMGAWDGTTNQIGCNFSSSTTSAPAVPDAPALTVS